MKPPESLLAPDLEAALVGAALMDYPAFWHDVAPADFHDERLAAVWAAGQHLVSTDPQGYADQLTVYDELERRGVAVPRAYLAHLTASDAVNVVGAATYAAAVRDKAARRRALAVLQTGVQVLHAADGSLAADLAAVADKLARTVPPATDTRPARRGATWADMATLIGPVAWAWPDWLPAGLLVELVADSGVGKSVLALRIAATYIQGWMWPDGTPFQGPPGKVLWVETEAGQALNLERAQAWGLPIEHIVSPFENPLDDASLLDPVHLAAIAAEAAHADVRLIVVDSLSGGTAGKEKGEDQMPVVKWLAELARNLYKPVLLLHHLRKRGPADGGDVVTLDRVRGSTVIVQPARVVWALDIPNPNTLEHKRLSVIKSNLGRFPKSVGVRIDDTGMAFDAAPTVPKTLTKLDQAKLLLLRLLAGGPRLQTELEAEGLSEGVSADTLREAKKKLGCRVSKDGHTGKWSWRLPDTSGEQDGEQDGVVM